jgi:hypothetical protein
VIGVCLNAVIIWDDVNKTGIFNASVHNHTVFNWNELSKRSVNLIGDNKYSSVNMSYGFADSNFTVSINISTGASLGRHENLPRLLMSPSSFHTEMIVYGSPGVNYSYPRVIIPFDTVHSRANFSLTRVSRIDDEYSPGVFSDETLSVGSNEDKTYITWKPVGYSRADRIIAKTLDAVKLLTAHPAPLGPEEPVLYGFYYPKMSDSYIIQSLQFSLGAAKDTQYSESNYTSFSFNIGLGEPADEGLSFLVQMVILVGFGLPVIALLLSAFFVGYRRYRRSRGNLIDFS